MNQNKYKTHNLTHQIGKPYGSPFCRFMTMLRNKSHALLYRGALIAVAALIVPSSAAVLFLKALGSRRKALGCKSNLRSAIHHSPFTIRSLQFLATLAIFLVTSLSAIPSTLYPRVAKAQTPNTTINFQARILLASGALVPDGDYNVEFKLYDSSAAGATAQGVCSLNSTGDDCWWLETRTGANKVRVVNGYVSANLGSVTAFGSSIPWSQDLYVTMRVGGTGAPSWDTEMTNATTGRMKLSAVPYAFTASNLRTSDRTATASDSITIQTGNTTTSGNSGNITIDTGTAAGTTGTITLGATSASALTLGRSGAATTLYGTSSSTLNLTNGSYTTVLGVTTPTANQTYNLPDSSTGTYTICTTANNCTGLGAYIQNGTVNQNTANFNIQSAATGSVTAKFRAIASQTADILQVRDSGDATTVFSVSPAGNTLAGGTLQVTGAATFNGNLTVGDASGDTVTVNSGAWTFANDATIALTGGVNGLNIDSNTLSIDATSNRVGIGTASPDASLDVEGAAGTELIRLSNSTTADSSGIFSGSGTPEAVVTAQVGSLFTDTTNGKVYKKGSGDGTNTGWQELAVGSANSMVEVYAYNNANQNVNNVTSSYIALNSERYDSSTLHDTITNNTRLTAPSTGTYIITGSVEFASNATGNRACSIRMNRGNFITSTWIDANSSGTTQCETTTVYQLTAGDYVELVAYQSSGGLLSVNYTANQSPNFSMAKLDGGVSSTLQGAYDSGNTITSTDARDLLFTMADTATDSNFIVNLAGQGDFTLQDAGVTFATFADTGAITLAPTSGQDLTLNFTGNGRLDVNATTYENNLGAVDVVRSTNFTGVAAETANELRIAPSLTVTEPASGTFTWNGTNIDMSGVTVTAGAGTSVLNGLRVAGLSDADAGTVNGILLDTITGTAATERGLTINSGWDANLYLNDTTAVLGIADTGNLTINDGTNALLTVTDSGTTGAVAVTGTLAVNGASVTVGTASTTNGTLVLQNSTNAFTTTITASAQTVGSATLSLPDTAGAADTICLVGLANCTGSGSGGTLQASYNADVNGSDSTITLTPGDDSLIISNPSSSGTDSAYVLRVEQLNTGSLDALQVSNSGTGDILELQDAGTAVLKVSDGGHLLAVNVATATTGTTEAVARTNVTTVTLTAAGSFANNDIIFLNNAVQDYYTRIVSGGGTTTLVVSPAVSYDVSTTVTKYTAQNIGATASDYATQTQRFFQGYFLGGVVAGAGSTTLSDQSLMSTGALYVKTNGESTRLTIDTSGNSTFSGNLTVSGGVASLGAEDTGAGGNQFNVYGGTTGANEGGQISLYTSADWDTTINSYDIDVYQDSFRIFNGGGTSFKLNSGSHGTQLTYTQTDDADATDTNNGLDISVTSSSGDADTLRGINISNISGGVATEVGLRVGTGWDTDLQFADTSPIIGVADAATLYLKDSGGNNLLTVADAGTTGDGTFSGDLTVTGGNLGIGTAANSSYVLQAYYDSNTYAGFSNNDNGDFYISGSNADLYVVDDSNSSYYTRIHNNGSDGYIDTGGTSGDLYLRPGGNDVQFVGSGGTGRISMASTNNMEFFAPGDATASLVLQNGKNVYVNVTAATGATHLCYSAFGRIEACTSSRALKHDITDTVYGIDQLRQLRPVQYTWNASGKNDAGFIAEEVAPIIPETTEWNTDGSVKSFDFDPIISVLTKSMQQLDVQVQSNDSRLDVLESGEFAGDLHVNGNVQFDGDLAVTGDAILTNLVVTGDTEVDKITVNGKIITAGAIPTVVLGTQATGSGAVITLTGNDIAGTIIYEAGTELLPTNPLVVGEQVNVDFVEAYTAQPRVTVSPTSEAAAKARYYITRSTTGFKLVFVDAPVAGETYSYDYQILQ